MADKYFMFENAEIDKPYDKVAYYRCMKIEEFVDKLQEKNKIVGITVSDNNIGFIIDDKEDMQR